MPKLTPIAALVACATLAAATLAGCAGADTPTPTDIPPTAMPTNTPSPTPEPTPTLMPDPTVLTAAMASDQLPRIGPERTYELRNTQEWLNGTATTIAALRDAGRVVMVDFWTYT